MSAVQQTPVAGVEISLRIGQRVRHQDYQGKRVTGVVRGLSIDLENALMVDCVLDAPIVIPPGDGFSEIQIHRQHAPAHEFAPFDDRDEVIEKLLTTLETLLPYVFTAVDEACFVPGLRPAAEAARAVVTEARKA